MTYSSSVSYTSRSGTKPVTRDPVAGAQPVHMRLKSSSIVLNSGLAVAMAIPPLVAGRFLLLQIGRRRARS
jgi:hypothetical protein